jgi:hypothetical protein
LEICDLELAHFIEFIPGNSDDDFVINIVEVKRDREWFSRELPKMKKFWDSVLEAREKGVESNKEYQDYRSRCEKRKKRVPVQKVEETTLTVNQCYLLPDEPEPEPDHEIKKVVKIIKKQNLFIEE